MFRETARRIGTAVNVRIGDPISDAALKGFSDERMMAVLRERTENLANPEVPMRLVPRMPSIAARFPALPEAALASIKGLRNRRHARQAKVPQFRQ